MQDQRLDAVAAEYKALSGQFNVEEATGIVECFVAAIGNKDSVGDVVLPGAFDLSLKRRKPRVVWGHNWNEPIGKVLDIYEVGTNDPRLPAKMRSGGVGGLYARVQFNLKSERGKEAFTNVAFFGHEQEWSIGYKTINASFDPANNANLLKEVELYEVSPVLHGANQLTATISIKSDQQSQATDEEVSEDYIEAKGSPCWDGYMMVGMKKGKNGKMVPNCVPMSSDKSSLKDPDGGLTAAGRAHFKRTEGANLKPGVKGAADTPQKMRRKGSFLTRFFTNPSGPMKDSKGRPTRLALSARAWGEPVPQNGSDASALAAKGRRLLERYENSKKKSDESFEFKNHIADVYAASISLARPEDYEKVKLSEAVSKHFGGPSRIMYADPNMMVVEIRKDGVDEMLRIPYHNENGQYMFGSSQRVRQETVFIPVDSDGALNVYAKPNESSQDADHGDCGCDSCGKPMPSWLGFKKSHPGKHLFIKSSDDIALFEAINELSLDNEFDVELLEDGIAIKNIDGIDESIYEEILTIADDLEEKGIGRAIGRGVRGLERFDPAAFDGDADRLIQEGTPFERFGVNKPRMMPATPEQIPKPEKVPEPVPEKVPAPARPRVPGVPTPSRPTPARPTVPVGSRTGLVGALSAREIYEQRMAGASLQDMADKLKTTRERIRRTEQQWMRNKKKRKALAQDIAQRLANFDRRNAAGLDDDAASNMWLAEDLMRMQVKFDKDFTQKEALRFILDAADLHDKNLRRNTADAMREVAKTFEETGSSYKYQGPVPKSVREARLRRQLPINRSGEEFKQLKRSEDNASEVETKRDFSPKKRQAMAKRGLALDDGSYPISSVADLENAVQAYGRAKDKPRAKRHIIKRAKDLGAESTLPESWRMGAKADVIPLAKTQNLLMENGVMSRLYSNGLQIMIPTESIFEAKSMIDVISEEFGFSSRATEDGIRIFQASTINDETINEIVSVAVKASGTRMNIPMRGRSVQQNKPSMGYPKNGAETGVVMKYSCMVSGEKRMSPCAGCSNPQGCLSKNMHFKETE